MIMIKMIAANVELLGNPKSRLGESWGWNLFALGVKSRSSFLSLPN